MKNANTGNRVGTAFLVAGAVLAAWRVSPLRIADPEWNQWVNLFSQWLAAVALAFGLARLPSRVWVNLLGCLFTGLAVVMTALVFLGMIGGGPVAGYERLDSVESGWSRVIAYQTNPGATVDFGVEIFHEMTVFPGVVLSRKLHDGQHEYEAGLEIEEPGVVTATINGSRRHRFVLRRFIWF